MSDSPIDLPPSSMSLEMLADLLAASKRVTPTDIIFALENAAHPLGAERRIHSSEQIPALFSKIEFTKKQLRRISELAGATADRIYRNEIHSSAPRLARDVTVADELLTYKWIQERANELIADRRYVT